MPVLSNSRHERFAQAIAKGMSDRAAYVEAGYKPHDANPTRLKNRSSVKERVTEIQTAAAAEAQLTVQWVIDGIRENYARAMQHKEVKDHEGNGTGEYRYEGAVANKCLELAGKILNVFTDKVDHSHNIVVEMKNF